MDLLVGMDGWSSKACGMRHGGVRHAAWRCGVPLVVEAHLGRDAHAEVGDALADADVARPPREVAVAAVHPPGQLLQPPSVSEATAREEAGSVGWMDGRSVARLWVAVGVGVGGYAREHGSAPAAAHARCRSPRRPTRTRSAPAPERGHTTVRRQRVEGWRGHHHPEGRAAICTSFHSMSTRGVQ